MRDNPAAATYRFALACLSQLASSGVRTVVASPGFRNSPLLLAAHRTTGLEVLSAVDERGAAFLALGLARAQRAPVALLCTSGTAVGNYLPAVMEAAHSQVPLLLLTGDRPPELVGTGANQCTDQAKIFGSFVRGFFDTAPPTGDSFEENHAGYLIGKAVSRSLQPVPGPVHVNLRFREPFLPAAEEAARLENEARPMPWSFLGSASGPSHEQAAAIRSMLQASKRPLFVLGPGSYSAKFLGILARLSIKSGIPVAAEAASGLAFCEEWKARLLHRPESLFGAISRGELESPDLFIRLGAPLTGRAYPQLLAKCKLPQLVLDAWGEAREPGFHPSVMVEGNLEAWLDHDEAWNGARADPDWAESLLSFGKKEETRLEQVLSENTAFTECHFQRALARLLGKKAQLFLGNSMPIRDFNSVFPREAGALRLFSNRGLSGIDGLIASALGVAIGGMETTHAVLGDLSTLHDLPSLSLLQSYREKASLTLWVMNNAGGEIFRIVQTAKSGGNPEWFTTPQEFDLAALAKAFRISYTRVQDHASLESLSPEMFAEKGVRIVEVIVDKEANLAVRKALSGAH